MADRELEVWALLDVTPSMNWGTEGVTKRDLGIAAIATIGFLSQKMGDRFGGFIMRPDSLRRLPAPVFSILLSLEPAGPNGVPTSPVPIPADRTVTVP